MVPVIFVLKIRDSSVGRLVESVSGDLRPTKKALPAGFHNDGKLLLVCPRPCRLFHPSVIDLDLLCQRCLDKPPKVIERLVSEGSGVLQELCMSFIERRLHI